MVGEALRKGLSSNEYQKNSWVPRALSKAVPRLEIFDLVHLVAVGTIQGMSDLEIQKLIVKHYNTLLLQKEENRYDSQRPFGYSPE